MHTCKTAHDKCNTRTYTCSVNGGTYVQIHGKNIEPEIQCKRTSEMNTGIAHILEKEERTQIFFFLKNLIKLASGDEDTRADDMLNMERRKIVKKPSKTSNTEDKVYSNDTLHICGTTRPNM